MSKKTVEPFKTSKKVNCGNANDKIRKEIVRNPNVPLRENAVKTVNLDFMVSEDCTSTTDQVSESQAQTLSKTKGINPNNPTANKFKDKNIASEKSQAEIKRVNIPFCEKKFKGLVDLGSLEAVLAEKSAESSSGSSKRRACLPKRDPEPLLSDYYQPKFDTEYVFSFPIAPIKISKEWSYNPRSVVDILEKVDSESTN